MKNSSFSQSHWFRFSIFCIVVAIALSARVSRAQCSDDTDQDSLECQMQAPAESSIQTQTAPAVFDIAGPEQKRPRADRSNEASAVGSLTVGSTFTEGSTRQDVKLSNAALLAPEPSTEFQRFVAATTGQMPPVYGIGLFTDQFVSFGPINNAPAPANLILAPDDELQIRIWGQVNFSANLRIGREGDVYLPKVGDVHVAGMTLAAAQDHLRGAMDRIYRNFDLSVDLGKLHSIEIYVTGMARQPGEYTVSALSTLVDAVFQSGGPSSTGSMRHIELERDGKVLTDFDLYELLIRGSKTGDIELQPGDVLYIPPSGSQVALLGSVRKPAIYELRGQESLGNLLDMAGGRTPIAASSRISIDRISDHAERRAYEMTDDAAGLATRMEDGDIVRIDAITSKYSDTVTLRGAVANPGHFRWAEGMHLSDLIPDRDSLVTRGYWWRRTQLGLPAPEFTPASGATEKSGSGAMASPGGETDWDFAVIERLDRSTMKTSLIRFNLGMLVLQHDASQDLAIQPGDIVTIFSQDEINMPVDRKTKYVELEGEIANAGVYSVSPGETLQSLVERAGGLTSKAYLFGAELTRKSTQVLEQQRINEYTGRLEHVMEREALAALESQSTPNSQQGSAASTRQALMQPLPQLRATGRIVISLDPDANSANDLPAMDLEDGDRLLIPPRPLTIQVVGAVFNQNAFLCSKDARVKRYLHLAGGPTREADRRQIFVLRANGSVIHGENGNSIFDSSGVDNVRLYPGDTIVVPEKAVKPSGVRGLADWTQVLSQLSLSAAAVDVIK
jgi:protein involved in polysaccharide export with SLBB domain